MYACLRWVMTHADPSGTTAIDAQNNAATPHRLHNRTGRIALSLAIFTSVLVIGLEAVAGYLPTFIEATNVSVMTVFNAFGVLRRFVIGLLSILTIICAARSLRAANQPRGGPAAALALGSFHLTLIIVTMASDLLQS